MKDKPKFPPVHLYRHLRERPQAPGFDPFAVDNIYERGGESFPYDLSDLSKRLKRQLDQEGTPKEKLENPEFMKQMLLRQVSQFADRPGAEDSTLGDNNTENQMAEPFFSGQQVNGTYFVYGLNGGSVSIPIGGTNTANITITADSDFVASQINASSTRDFLYQIRYTGADRFFSSVAQHSANATGSGQRPFFLPVPVFVQNNSVLNITFTDLGVAPGSNNVVYFELIGAKIQIGSWK